MVRSVVAYSLISLLFSALPRTCAIVSSSSVSCEALDYDDKGVPNFPRHWFLQVTNIPPEFQEEIDEILRGLQAHTHIRSWTANLTTADDAATNPNLRNLIASWQSNPYLDAGPVVHIVRDIGSIESDPTHFSEDAPLACDTPMVPRLNYTKIPLERLPDEGADTICTVCHKPLSDDDAIWAIDVGCKHKHMFHFGCISGYYMQSAGIEATKCPACGAKMAIIEDEPQVWF